MLGGATKGINKFMDNQTERWVVVVYDDGDKIASRIFHGDNEDEVLPEARQWVISGHGEGADWSFHHIVA